MKKILALLVCFLLVFSSASVFADEIGIEINGDALNCDVAPIIRGDRVLVPFRAIFEALSCAVSYRVEEDGNYVYVFKQNDTLIHKIGSNSYFKNGETVEFDVPSCIVDDRTLVPIRAVSEALGCKVSWDDEARKVIIENEQNIPYKSVAIEDDTDELYISYVYPVFENELDDAVASEVSAFLENVSTCEKGECPSYFDFSFDVVKQGEKIVMFEYINLNGESTEKIVPLAPSNEISFNLKGNPTTGYTWKAENNEFVEVTSDYKMDEHLEGVVGVGGQYTITVKGVKEGLGTLELNYMREWEGKESSIKTEKYEVSVDKDLNIIIKHI